MMGAAGGTPSHWLVYFSVADADVCRGGGRHGADGTCARHGQTTPRLGRIAVLADLFGATFALIQLPPRGRRRGATSSGARRGRPPRPSRRGGRALPSTDDG